MITFSKIGSFGRLGNQLFQIAATLGAAKLYNDIPKFYTWEHSDSFKNPIDQTLISSEIKNIYKEPSFNYTQIPQPNNTDLHGYFQSEKYFSHCEDLIRHHFDFKEEGIKLKYYGCSIHIRRGDYVNLANYHTNLGPDYYADAIRDMEMNGVTQFVVFSDDINWCKTFLGDDPKFVYIEGQTPIQDLCLMSKCEHHIIANSSFSWWGSWLNPSKDKIVIAPKNWFGPSNKNADTSDLYCKGWKVM